MCQRGKLTEYLDKLRAGFVGLKEVPDVPLARQLRDIPATVVLLQRLPLDAEIQAFRRQFDRSGRDQ